MSNVVYVSNSHIERREGPPSHRETARRVHEVGRRRKSFHDRLKLEIQWKIQSGINADHIRAIRCGAANETSDLLFRIRDKNFTEGKEVFLPMLRANSRMEFPNNRSAYFFLCPEFLDR